MIVSIPTPTTSHTCSEHSTVRTLGDMITDYGTTHKISKGLELISQEGSKIYKYSLEKSIKVTPYDSSKSYSVGDIVIKAGVHQIITKKVTTSGEKWAYEPEEYADNETDINKWTSWKGRYFKTKKRGRMQWAIGGRGYYFYKRNQSPCKTYAWKVWQIGKPKGCYADMQICMGGNDSKYFKESEDIVGINKWWGTPREHSLIIRSGIVRGDYWYFRTHIKYPVKYHTSTGTTKYSLRKIKSPDEINGFRYSRMTECFAAFDDKNYNYAVFEPESGKVTLSYTTTEETDTIAIGRVYSESLSVVAKDPKGNNVFSVSNYPMANEIADSNIGQAVNVILYSENIMPHSTTVEITFNAGWTSVGRILAGRMLKLGFTNTLFENGFKDFSPREQDQWGNVLYKNGVRVYIHSGTVDLPLKEYDALNRAFMFIGGQEMIINSSDSINNTPPNSLTVFQSTMFIGRFTAFKQRTKNVGDLMDSVATWNFSAEESV